MHMLRGGRGRAGTATLRVSEDAQQRYHGDKQSQHTAEADVCRPVCHCSLHHRSCVRSETQPP